LILASFYNLQILQKHMNQTDRSNKKTNAYARKKANERGKKAQEEMDKNLKQQKLF